MVSALSHAAVVSRELGERESMTRRPAIETYRNSSWAIVRRKKKTKRLNHPEEAEVPKWATTTLLRKSCCRRNGGLERGERRRMEQRLLKIWLQQSYSVMCPISNGSTRDPRIPNELAAGSGGSGCLTGAEGASLNAMPSLLQTSVPLPTGRFKIPQFLATFFEMLAMNILSSFSRVLGSAFWSGRPIVNRMKPLIIIYGSTGTGKSDVGVVPSLSVCLGAISGITDSNPARR